jgi:hypothetical protein
MAGFEVSTNGRFALSTEDGFDRFAMRRRDRMRVDVERRADAGVPSCF